METNILLENGTNELEVLEFTLNENHYGINVAKIREILTYQPITPVPNSNSNVEGIFMPRDTMISVINLKRCLGIKGIAAIDVHVLLIDRRRVVIVELGHSCWDEVYIADDLGLG